MGAVQDFCDRAMLISNGDIVMIGKSGKVARAYNELNLEAIESSEQNAKQKQQEHHGTHAVEIAKTYTRLGDKRKRVFRPHERCEIVVEYKANEMVEDPIMGITIKDLTGRPLIVTNTKAKKVKTGTLQTGDTYRAVFTVDTVLSDGTYSVSPAIASEDAKIFYDWIEDACEFDVAGWEFPAALVQPEHSISINRVQ
jgi:ABC-type glutathione transport system ATPase component